MRVNWGCGKNPVEGYTNVDDQHGPGVDMVLDMETWTVGPKDIDTITESMGLHVIEHLADSLRFMEQLWAATVPGGTCVLACPYGSSDDAWENPDHKRPYFIKSWGFFGQPNYWREGSYGYVADWRVREVELRFTEENWEQFGSERRLHEVLRTINLHRNVVSEQVVTLECMKPARSQDKALQEPIPVRFSVLVQKDEFTNNVVSAEDYEQGARG